MEHGLPRLLFVSFPSPSLVLLLVFQSYTIRTHASLQHSRIFGVPPFRSEVPEIFQLILANNVDYSSSRTVSQTGLFFYFVFVFVFVCFSFPFS